MFVLFLSPSICTTSASCDWLDPGSLAAAWTPLEARGEGHGQEPQEIRVGIYPPSCLAKNPIPSGSSPLKTIPADQKRGKSKRLGTLTPTWVVWRDQPEAAPRLLVSKGWGAESLLTPYAVSCLGLLWPRGQVSLPVPLL